MCIKSLYFWKFMCFFGHNSPQSAMVSSFTRFLDHTQRRTAIGRTPLDEWSARHTDLYLTTQQSQQTNNHAPGGIRTHNLSRRAAADLRLRPHGHWDRLRHLLTHNISEPYTSSRPIWFTGTSNSYACMAATLVWLERNKLKTTWFDVINQ
jgi:hypothetical protein